MQCPFCHAEMESGYLQSARMIIWSPEKKSILPKLWFWEKGRFRDRITDYGSKIVVLPRVQ